MNQHDPTLHDFDERLDRAIDALNREASPAPHEYGDLDMFSLVDTARLAKSLRDPADPDPGFADLAVSRIAADLNGPQAMNANGIPPASPPSVRALPSTEVGDDDRPRGIVGWFRDMSELAAILVVGLLVLGGIIFYQTVWSGGDGDSPGAGPIPTATEEPAPAVTELEIEGAICCGTHGEIGGENYLFVLTQGGGEQEGHGALHVVRVDEQGSLELAGSIDTPLAIAPITPVGRLGFENGRVYVPVPGREESGLWVVDVSDPASPAEVDLVEMERPPLSVTVSNGVAVVSTMSFSGPIVFFDVSNPDDVQPVSEYEHSMSSMPPSIEFVDSLLYVADHSGVSIFDLSAPEEPQEIGTYESPDWDGPTSSSTGIQIEDDEWPGFHDIAVVDGYLYIAASDAGLRVVDASDPSNLQEASHLDLPGRAVRVATLRDTVYVLGMDLTSGQPFNIHVIDASNPANPQPVGTVAVPIVPFPQALMNGADIIYLLGGRTVQIIDPDADSSPDDGGSVPPTPVESTPAEPGHTQAPDESGTGQDLMTFEEAQEITPFELIQPDPLPEELELIGVDVRPATDTTTFDEAYLMYELVDGEMPEEPIIFRQSDARLEAGHWSATEETIGSRSVIAFHTAIDDEGIPLAVYTWTEGDVMGRSYMVSARLDGDLTEQHLESLIAALPDEDDTAPDGSGP